LTPELKINIEAMTEFLVGLLNTPSPTGYYLEAIEYTRKAFEALAVPGLLLGVTTKGALLAAWKGTGSEKPRGMTAHIDTLGLMVKEVKGNGRLRTTQLGGFAWNAVEFEGVTVRTFANQRYRGTALLDNPSTHVNRSLGTTERNAQNMEIRLDVKTRSADETRALGIEVGDFIFLDPRVEVTDTGFIRSRHLDDKAGVAAIYGALMALKEAGLQPTQDTTILIANYEEVGHGGAAGFPAGLAELLTIDMGAMGDGQSSDEFSVSICAKDSQGPYHFMLMNKMRELATHHAIPYKMDIYPFYGSDGEAYWHAGGEAQVALVGPGIDASHGYERTHKDSLIHTAHLIARYMVS
jgi:putative aminopeptidase FrvX